MFRAIEKEIKIIHKVYRNQVSRYEVYLDYGLNIKHVIHMCWRLQIDTEKEPDLIWIAYLYCLFILKYSNKNTNLLETLIFNKKENLYDPFFKLLLYMQRILREFMMKNFQFKRIKEVSEAFSWLKFYDEEKQTIFYYNFYKNKRSENLTDKDEMIYYKYFEMERAKFIEFLLGFEHIVNIFVDNYN